MSLINVLSRVFFYPFIIEKDDLTVDLSLSAPTNVQTGTPTYKLTPKYGCAVQYVLIAITACNCWSFLVDGCRFPWFGCWCRLSIVSVGVVRIGFVLQLLRVVIFLQFKVIWLISNKEMKVQYQAPKLITEERWIPVSLTLLTSLRLFYSILLQVLWYIISSYFCPFTWLLLRAGYHLPQLQNTCSIFLTVMFLRNRDKYVRF